MIGKVNDNLEVLDILGTLKEEQSHDWTTVVMAAKWYDNKPTIDIRNMNFSTKRVGKGISLKEEEVEKLTDILLENDFASIDVLEKHLIRKKKRFIVSVPDIDSKDVSVEVS